MKYINGITITKKSDFAVCHINDFTDEIKHLLRDNLSFICYGCSCSESGKELYNYANTLQEFLKRYKGKTALIKKGMIGELLSHLIINEYFPEYNVISPFFNKEERSIKKGFDIVLSAQSDCSIWITEVKSGELHKEKNAAATSFDLLSTAKSDLIDRLNTENRSLWLNAINDAKIAYERHSDLKESIVEILENYGTKAGTDEAYGSAQMNVFLVSALFAPLDDVITPAALKSKSDVMKSESIFKKIFIMSIQKSTYKKVYNFLEQESEL